MTDFIFDTEIAGILDSARHRFPSEAFAGYARTVKASERHEAEQAVTRARGARLAEAASELARTIHDLERSLARDEYTAPARKEAEQTLKHSRERRAKVVGERKNLLQNPAEPNLPPERLVDFFARSKGNFKYAPADIRLAKGQTLAEALSGTREQIADVGRNKQEAKRALLPLAEAKKRIADDVRANALAPDVSQVARLLQHVGEVAGADRRPDVQGHVSFPSRNVALGVGSSIDVDLGARMLCWVAAEQIIAKLTADLEKMYAGKTVLSVEERTRVIAELDAEQLNLEFSEESITRAMEDAGHIVWRRPQANPLAVLQVRPA